MQKVWLNGAFIICIIFCVSELFSASSSGLDVSQVSQIAQNIEMATQIGQTGQEAITNVADLQKNAVGTIFDMTDFSINTSRTTVLKSLAFGGYTFISNIYNPNKSVSANIVSDLYKLQVNPSGSLLNDIWIGLVGFDNQGKYVTNLSNSALSIFKLYIFDRTGKLVASTSVPLDRYFSQTQDAFITPVFAGNTTGANSGQGTVQKLPLIINGSSVDIPYPYLVKILNISDIDMPNRFMTFQEIYDIFYGAQVTLNEVSFPYKEINSLEFIIGPNAYSFNQNSSNQSTTQGPNGIAYDISQIIAPYQKTNFKVLLVAVDVNGNIITSFDSSTNVGHYLLCMYDMNLSLIKSVHVNPVNSTPASKFNVNQSINNVTVLLNGKTLNATPYTYPILIDLSYNSGFSLPSINSIPDKITLKATDSLTSLDYQLTAASGSAEISFKGTSFLDAVQVFLDMGITVFVNMTQQPYSQTQGEYELVFTAYSLGKTTADSQEIVQNSFLIPTALTALSIQYGLNNSTKKESLNASSLNNSWLAIIPSVQKKQSSQGISYDQLTKLSTYQSFSAILKANNITLYNSLVTATGAQSGIIPGWYNPSSKQTSGSGFSLTLDQMSGGNGYYFIQDQLHNNVTTKFNSNSQSGVAALSSSSQLLSQLKKTVVPSGSCTIMLLCFDSYGNFIPDITKSNADPKYNPHKFGLFIFDTNGNLLQQPSYFSVNDYVGLANFAFKSGSQAPSTFTFNGLGSQQQKTLTYPFALQVNWNIKGKIPTPKPGPTPTPPSIPATPDATVSLLTGKVLRAFNYMGETAVGKMPIVPSLSATFLQVITNHLKSVADGVWVNLTNNGTTVTAVAYTQKKGKIASTSMTVPNVETITNGFYYGYNQILADLKIISVNPAKVNNLWIKFVVSNPTPPTIPKVPDQIVRLMPQPNLAQFNYTVFEKTGTMPVTPTLSTTFLQVINANLKNSGDEIWVNLTNDGTTVTAQAYNKQKINIGSTSMPVQTGTITNGFYYGYSQNPSDITKIPATPATVNNLWIKFKTEWIDIPVQAEISNFGYILQPGGFQPGFGSSFIPGINDYIQKHGSIMVNLQVTNNTITATTYPKIPQPVQPVTLSSGQTVSGFGYQEEGSNLITIPINSNQQSNLWIWFSKATNAK